MLLTSTTPGGPHGVRAVLATAALSLAALVAAFGSTAQAGETTGNPMGLPIPGVPPIVAQASPGPTATPKRFTYSGYVRSFDMTRLNNPQLNPKNALNQASWNTGVSLHGGYDFGGGFSIGATYFYADPFAGSCNSAASHAIGPPCVNANTQTKGQGTNPNDTVPGFQMSTLYETYVQYKDPALSNSLNPQGLLAKVGDQVISTPWAWGVDTRLKPVSFRGADAAYTFDKNWSVEVMDMDRAEFRAESDFSDFTLLTGTKIASANYGGAPSNLVVTPYTAIDTNGFTYGRVSYASPTFTTNLHFYDFLDIATAFWLDGKYQLSGYLKPAFSFQLGSEHDSGRAVLGKIDSQIYGVQAQISPTKFLDFLAGVDVQPGKQDLVTLPSTVTCSSSNAISAKTPFMYFLPAGGTPQCRNVANGQTIVYYGGWASPYTSGYVGDPLFSTTLTTSMVDRASPGQALQLQLIGYALKRQLRLQARQGWYVFGDVQAGVAPTREFDADAWYFFNKVRPGPYKGLSFRYRYGERVQHYFTGNPDYKDNRAQLEYDF